MTGTRGMPQTKSGEPHVQHQMALKHAMNQCEAVEGAAGKAGEKIEDDPIPPISIVPSPFPPTQKKKKNKEAVIPPL